MIIFLILLSTIALTYFIQRHFIKTYPKTMAYCEIRPKDLFDVLFFPFINLVSCWVMYADLRKHDCDHAKKPSQNRWQTFLNHLYGIK